MYWDTELTVRYAETDQMGIVHHSNYPIWFEVGRTEFVKQLGVSYSEIEKNGFMLPLIGLNCIYKTGAHYEDVVIIRTSIKELSKVRITFSYEVIRKIDGKLLASGETMHAWTDKSLKPVNFKKKMPDLYEIFNKALES